MRSLGETSLLDQLSFFLFFMVHRLAMQKPCAVEFVEKNIPLNHFKLGLYGYSTP